MRIFFFLLVILFFSSCALPAGEEKGITNFIPPKELAVLEFSQEGMNYFNLSRWVDSELKFRQALYLEPKLGNLKMNLAGVLEKQGLFEEAEEIYKVLEKDREDKVRFQVALARLDFLRGEFKLAKEYYERALAEAYDKSDITLIGIITDSLSTLGFHIGDMETAICYASETWRTRTGTADFQKYMKLLIAQGRYEEVLDKLIPFVTERTLEKDPTFLHYRALAHFGIGDFKIVEEFETMGLEQGGLDPALEFEMKLVRGVVRELERRKKGLDSGKEGIEIDEEELEAVEKEREELIEILTQVKEGDIKITLYWPVNLLEIVFEVLEEESAHGV